MRLSRRTNTIILWVISLGLLVGMIITFTPSLGGGLSSLGQQGQQGGAALLVNGQPITDLDLARIRQQNQALSAIQTGQAASDIELLLLDSLIEQEVLRQAASSVRVTGGDVRNEVERFREAQGVAGRRNDDAYLRIINGAGYDDQSFRDLLREQLRLQRFQDGLLEGVEVSDAEAEAFYEINEERYRSEERILGRMIVVDDEELAADLLARAVSGESFADLASENSLERADRAGALGAPSGSDEPQPVGRAALPTAVANAAFSLDDGGLTDVLEVAGRYYLVSVEELRASETRPFDEVAEQVREDALAIKRQQVLQSEIERLRDAAEIVVPEDSLTVYQDVPVATVGDVSIHESELVRATYSNPQISQSLNPQTAELVAELFKPSFLQTLIDQELAFQGAQELDIPFLGTRDQVAQTALAYVTRDAVATDDEIATFYDENLTRYTVPASADATEVTFESVETATAFRAAVLAGVALDEAAEAGGGTVAELGTVGPGVLDEAVLDTALFETDAFEPLPEGVREVSDVLVLTVEPEADPADAASGEDGATDDGGESEEGAAATVGEDDGDEAETTNGETTEGENSDTDTADTDTTDSESTDADATDAEASEVEGGDEGSDGDAEGEIVGDGEAPVEERYVVLVAERTPERVQPLDEVRDQVEVSVLAAERTELRTAWLDELRERIEVENLLLPDLPDEPVPGEDEEGGEAGADDGSDDGSGGGDDAAPESDDGGSDDAGDSEGDGETPVEGEDEPSDGDGN